MTLAKNSFRNPGLPAVKSWRNANRAVVDYLEVKMPRNVPAWLHELAALTDEAKVLTEEEVARVQAYMNR